MGAAKMSRPDARPSPRYLAYNAMGQAGAQTGQSRGKKAFNLLALSALSRYIYLF